MSTNDPQPSTSYNRSSPPIRGGYDHIMWSSSSTEATTSNPPYRDPEISTHDFIGASGPIPSDGECDLQSQDDMSSAAGEETLPEFKRRFKRIVRWSGSPDDSSDEHSTTTESGDTNDSNMETDTSNEYTSDDSDYTSNGSTQSSSSSDQSAVGYGARKRKAELIDLTISEDADSDCYIAWTSSAPTRPNTPVKKKKKI